MFIAINEYDIDDVVSEGDDLDIVSKQSVTSGKSGWLLEVKDEDGSHIQVGIFGDCQNSYTEPKVNK